jgi:hypothetical protein
MKIVIMHEWLESSNTDLSDIKVIEISYVIFWKRGWKGMTVKKYTLDVSGYQRYDFNSDDEIDRLIEILSANWNHECLL